MRSMPAVRIKRGLNRWREYVFAGEGVDKPTQTKKTRAKKTPKKAPKKTQPKPKSIVNLPPSPVSPKTAFESLTVKRSSRFSPVQNTTVVDPSETTIQSHHSVFLRKIPKTTAKRKGLSTTSPPFEVDHETEGNNHTENEVDSSEGKKVDEPSAGSKNVKRKVDFGMNMELTLLWKKCGQQPKGGTAADI
ncbi:hypothetical protein POM88_014898 [Heracleum sosnowskyi]|uniref:Uncharacterized protein n=1 Tax=Heracleum sosnowskyi TaxID=360622 RepID=A0AAD8IJ73_9APIA|nr:hypothetical protein POM88_014898 [Heracleum sosnowskyi]